MPTILPVYNLGASTPGAMPLPGASPVYEYDPKPESSAVHWMLGPNAASLLPFGGSGTLTPQGTDHVFSANNVTVQGYNGALVSSIADQAEMTICRVFQYKKNAGKNTLLLGNISAAVNGFGIWMTGEGFIQTLLRGNTPALVNHGVLAGLADGDWAFIAYSEYLDGGVTKFNVVASGGLVYSGSFTAARPLSTRNDAIGNAYNSGATYTPAPLSTAEAIAFAGARKSIAELQAIKSRSTKRMATRGITVKA